MVNTRNKMVVNKIIFGILSLSVLLFLGLFITTVRDEGNTSLEQLQGNLSENIYVGLNNI